MQVFRRMTPCWELVSWVAGVGVLLELVVSSSFEFDMNRVRSGFV